ncbi:MAG: hypothetical protein KGO94_12620, partial [Alphaproteobacteria bacterium]|nr:hypothetical protein [Alphaproteobacteria bacterium]
MFEDESGLEACFGCPFTDHSKEFIVDATKTGRSAPKGRAIKGGGKARRGAIDPYASAPYGALDLGTNNCRLLIARPTS